MEHTLFLHKHEAYNKLHLAIHNQKALKMLFYLLILAHK